MKQLLAIVVPAILVIVIFGYCVFRAVEPAYSLYVGDPINKATLHYFQLGGSTPSNPDPYEFAQVLAYRKQIQGYVIPEGYNYNGIYVPDDRSSWKATYDPQKKRFNLRVE